MKRRLKHWIALSGVLFYVLSVSAQGNINNNKFRQLGQELPTPNEYRTASGAPGHAYWQQQADYKMSIEIDDEKQRLYGSEIITYKNNSPDELSYLWVQLDQNVRSHQSDAYKIRENKIEEELSVRALERIQPDFDGGFKIEQVKDQSGKDLKYIINNTMMRIDLPKPIKSGGSFAFKIKWWYNINNTKELGGRSGYEPFEEDGNNVYVIAQFFPRMCKYTDVDGWQNKQFYGRGEFTLEFGNYEVDITVPADHLVSSTGVLQNENAVLTADQKQRLAQAKNEYEQPITIATLEEADERMKGNASNKKSWKFKAEDIRDFAFATSRRFIWDAMNTKLPSGRTAMAMSMWTKEGDCLWSQYSTKAVAHTLKWYSHYTIDYPYPVAWSVDGNMGMEYPMMSFNYGRCESDGTYSKRMKYGHIGVIIHEVGHNFFPMIINSDERQWTWMDEGLNSFVQYLTEQQWERNYPFRRGPAENIVDYMKGDKSRISPIMTNSESIFQFGNNAYGKPATALNILRETVLGRDLFDYAFKEYATRWAFKSPTPADLFRTMEDASGTDLDWFWRGWFYTTDHVDLALTDVKHYKIDPKDPSKRKEMVLQERANAPIPIAQVKNKEAIKQTYSEIDPTILDFYSTYDPAEPTALDQKEYEDQLASMSDEEKTLLASNLNYYELTFENEGGLPMPIILEFIYTDGTSKVERIPAEIWRYDAPSVTKVFPTGKEVQKIVLDPYLETADVDREDNYFPKQAAAPDRFDVFKRRQLPRGADGRENPMQRANRAKTIRP